MNSTSEQQAVLREVDQSKYPELSGYSKAEIWNDIGPGGLYLVSQLAKELNLPPGAWVLDLGCGSAESSIYLAEKYKANVIAADLWQDPSENAKKIESRGNRGEIIPMRLDAANPLPFAEAYFDAILVVNNLNFYGTQIKIIDQIARYLKKGGIFCSGGECLNQEFTPEQIANPPAVYNFAEPVWKDDFLTSHSPGWWADHISRSCLLELVSCLELEDGQRYFEEQALLTPLEEEGYFGLSGAEARALEIRQIAYGQENRPYMTAYQLIARRR